MNEILVAVDSSKHSSKVVDVACGIAKGLSAGILLVYVMQLPFEEPEGVREFGKAEQYPDAYADYLQELGETVTSNFSNVIRKAGVSVRSMTPSGNPAAEVLNLAELEKSTMIVVGVKGLHGISRFRSLGSVARNIIENSPVPVVSVPSAAQNHNNA